MDRPTDSVEAKATKDGLKPGVVAQFVKFLITMVTYSPGLKRTVEELLQRGGNVSMNDAEVWTALHLFTGPRITYTRK
jgi:hypothetical protein